MNIRLHKIMEFYVGDEDAVMQTVNEYPLVGPTFGNFAVTPEGVFCVQGTALEDSFVAVVRRRPVVMQTFSPNDADAQLLTPAPSTDSPSTFAPETPTPDSSWKAHFETAAPFGLAGGVSLGSDASQIAWWVLAVPLLAFACIMLCAVHACVKWSNRWDAMHEDEEEEEKEEEGEKELHQSDHENGSVEGVGGEGGGDGDGDGAVEDLTLVTDEVQVEMSEMSDVQSVGI